MSTSLEDRLWDALEPAVARELERPWSARARSARRALRLRPAAALAVVLVALATGAAVIAVLDRPTLQPAEPPKHDVETVGVSESLGDAATGFGAVWTYDVADRRLLELDDASGRVMRAMAVPNPFLDVAVATGAGAVWAAPVHNSGHLTAAPPSRPAELVRIDPATGRQTAGIPIRVPGGGSILPFGVVAADDGVWVWGQTAAVRIDPLTNRVAGTIRVPGSHIKGFAVADRTAWVATDDKRLVRFDARSGERTGALPGRALMATTALIAVPGAVVLDGGQGTLYARDPADGRLVWTASAPGRVRSAVAQPDRIWILTPSATEPTDELVALEPGTGRAVARIGLPTAGGVALEAVGRDLWVTDRDGDLHIVRP